MKSKLPLAVALVTCLGTFSLPAQVPQPPSPPAQPGPPAPPKVDQPPAPVPPADRPEAQRGGDERRDREHRHPRRDRERRDLKPRPFLGIVTTSVPPAMSAQLGLPEGFGLLVESVLPDSPAQQAGIQQHDILKLFNDQQLVEPGQLATLVGAAGKDAKVTLTVIRKGQEQKLTVQIGERELPDRRPFFDMQRQMHNMGEAWREHARDLQEDVREQQRRARKSFEELREKMRDRHGEGAGAIPPKDVLREAKPGGGANLGVLKDNVFSSVASSKARVTLKDQDGELEVVSEDGNRVLTAKNPKGETIFNGPVNTPEEVQAVPQNLREKLEKIQVRDSGPASFRLGGGDRDNSAEDNAL